MDLDVASAGFARFFHIARGYVLSAFLYFAGDDQQSLQLL